MVAKYQSIDIILWVERFRAQRSGLKKRTQLISKGFRINRGYEAVSPNWLYRVIWTLINIVSNVCRMQPLNLEPIRLGNNSRFLGGDLNLC